MHRPKILFIGRVGFYTRDVIVFLAYIICILLAIVRADRSWIRPFEIIIICLITGYAAVLGGQFPAFLSIKRKNKKHSFSLKKFLFLLSIQELGLHSFGGLTGSLLALVLACRIFNISISNFLDLLAPSYILGMAFIRIGCFFNGCCYGTQSKAPWAVKFDDGLLRHPTQLYLAFSNLAIFGILLFAEIPKPFSGSLFLAALILYSLMRFFIDFLREDADKKKKFFGGEITLTQLLYLATAIGALSGFLILAFLKYDIIIHQ